MNNPVAPDEHPPYLNRCREMSFGQLREFIDDALRRLSDSESDAELPRSREEFVPLADMLNAKLDPLRLAAPDPPPPRPAYVGPEYPSSEPSGELASVYERHERLLEILHEAHGNPSSTRQYIGYVEHQLKDLEREIAERETSERQEHEKRLDDYREAREAHERSFRQWRAKAKGREDWQQKLDRREQIVERVRKDIERKFGSGAGVPSEGVHWRLLPPGALSEDRVRGYYAELQRRNPGNRYDPDRIVKALSLGPNQRYEEVGGVEGYTVFTFPYTSSVLLECSIVGNAIYVIHKDWKRWSRMTKQELMADESGEVVRIVHRPGWFEKVKQELGAPMTPDSGSPEHTNDLNSLGEPDTRA